MEITASIKDPSLIVEQDKILTPDGSKRFICSTCQDFGEVLAYGVDPDGSGSGTKPCPACGIPVSDEEEIPY